MKVYCLRLVADGIGAEEKYYYISNMSKEEVNKSFDKIFNVFKKSKDKDIYKASDKVIKKLDKGKKLELVDPESFSYFW